MKKGLYNFISVLLVIAVLGCFAGVAISGESPETTVKLYFKHLNSAEYSQAMDLYSKEARQTLDGLDDGAYNNWATTETKGGTIREVKIISSKARTKSAQVKYKLIYKDGSTRAKTVSLLKESGTWKMELIP